MLLPCSFCALVGSVFSLDIEFAHCDWMRCQVCMCMSFSGPKALKRGLRNGHEQKEGRSFKNEHNPKKEVGFRNGSCKREGRLLGSRAQYTKSND